MKIAILLYKPMAMPPSGYEFPTLLMARSFIKLGHRVKLFAVGKVETEVNIENGIKEAIIKGKTYPEKGFTFSRLKDFLVLYLLGYRPSITKLNENENFINKIKEYKPDLVVVSSIQIGQLARKIKRQLKGTKVISYTDSYDLVEASFNSIMYSKMPNIVKKIIIAMAKEKYTKYMLTLYKNLIKVGDVIVMPTEKDKEKIIQKFGTEKSKIFVIPPISIPRITKRYKKVKMIKTITFIGVADYGPNVEAVNVIKEKVAPKLKEIRFLIVGRGWKKEKQGNIDILGEVKDLKPIFNKTDAFIAPITSGAGMKTKIATYLEAGKPIIGTSVAFEGYGIEDSIGGIVEDNLDMIYERVYKFINNKKLILKLQTNSQKRVNSFSEENITKQWKKVLNNVY